MRNNSGSSGGRMKDEWDRLVHEVMIEQMFCFGKGEKLSHLKMGEFGLSQFICCGTRHVLSAAVAVRQ